MGWNPVKEAEKKAKQAIDKVVKPAVKKITDETVGRNGPIWKLRHETWDRITKLGDDVESKVKGAGRTVEKEVVGNVRKAGKEIEDGLTEKLPGLVEDAFVEKLPELVTEQAPKLVLGVAEDGLDAAQKLAAEVQKAIAKPGLQAAASLLQATYDGMCAVEKNEPELVEFLDSPGFGVTLGPISMSWAGMYTRAETILGVFDRWIDSPPDWSRRDIRELLTSFGPDSIDVDIDLSVNIVVVGSKALAIGGNVPSIPFPLAVYLLDKILEAAGVPE